jgi:hypothetical protein
MLSPARFKGLVGRGHAEFATNKQQDAAEFWAHLRQKLPYVLRKRFEFTEEKRNECVESGEVAYRTSVDNELRLFVPPDDEGEYTVRESCSQFDLLPLTSLTFLSPLSRPTTQRRTGRTFLSRGMLPRSASPPRRPLPVPSQSRWRILSAPTL